MEQSRRPHICRHHHPDRYPQSIHSLRSEGKPQRTLSCFTLSVTLLSYQNPASEPNPEQTASWLSFSLFTFLDPLINKASKVPHLPLEECPPLADYDWAHHLIQKSFPVGLVAVNSKFGANPCTLALGSALWICEEAYVLGPYESVSQGVHYARPPHGFQGEPTSCTFQSHLFNRTPQTFVGFMNPVAVNRLLT